MQDKRTIEEILSEDPFQTEGPTKYETYLNAALHMAFAQIRGLTKALEYMTEHQKEHERMHTAANVAAMSLPDSPVKDEKPN